MFATLQDRLSQTFRNLRGKGRLTDADIDATCREIRIALLEADVALPVVRTFIGQVRERAKGVEVSQALNPTQQVLKIVHEELVQILGGETRRLRFAKTPPTVILLAGLQGAGKTTLAGKLGHWLRAQGHQPLLVASDLQRPNAVQQLQIVGERAGVAVFAPEPGNVGTAEARADRSYGDPVAVARDGLAYARAKLYDVVIVDTAGRLGVDAEMMQQAIDIRDAVRPDEILFVLDAMVGQDAVTTARAFADGVGFDGVVLAKLDSDARGGAALSVREVTGKPVLFASNGEKLTDFDVFHPDRMASRILDLGDVLTLIEQAERVFDEKKQAELARKIKTERGFTLDDFLGQMRGLRKMGSLQKLLGMLPGMGEMRAQLDELDDADLDRLEAIISSMTPAERADPKLINGSRRARIAGGSGTTVTDVNQLVERFLQARKMMAQLTRGRGIPGMGIPGMGGGPGGKARSGKKAKARQKAGRSGNPARRIEQEQAAAALEQERAAARDAEPVDPAAALAGLGLPGAGGRGLGSPGAGGRPAGATPQDQPFELPEEFRDLLGKQGR